MQVTELNYMVQNNVQFTDIEYRLWMANRYISLTF